MNLGHYADRAREVYAAEGARAVASKALGLVSREASRMATVLGDHVRYAGGRRERIVDEFHRLYYRQHYRGGTWKDTYWLGVPAQKYPTDLWIYQEILAEQRPDVVVETGTAAGGSALFLATVCDALGNGRVLTVDVQDAADHPDGDLRPDHDRITYVTGSSTSEAVLERVRGAVGDDESVLVVLDSDHRKDHVLAELRAYGEIVTPDSYLIVEDTDLNGNPIKPDWGPGPAEATAEFLATTSAFEVDESREKLLLTANRGGFLRKLPAE